ncbi:MAG: heme o synthase [Planctomycetota bacterium]|nr:heme o synthase [Planctomycetota bacterium]
MSQPTTSASASRWSAFVELGKLRLSSLAILAVFAGLLLGTPNLPTLPSWWVIAGSLLGTAMVAVGGNAMNMWLERDTDVHMERTEGRPIQSGRLNPADVFWFGLLNAIGGVVVLALTTNLPATLFCALIFVLYVGVYTPLKRRNTLNTLVGAIPGALPPVVGYAASSGQVDMHAGVLFLILFFWQIPHFLAIAWRYKDQYRNAGLMMLPSVEGTGLHTGKHMMTYGLCLVGVSIMPALPAFGFSSRHYVYSAVLLGVLFLAVIFEAAVLRRPAGMRRCFIVSIIYLPLLFVAMVTDRLTPHVA